MWMNDGDVEDAVRRFGDDTPNLARGARILARLVAWTNSHSDGWAYWQKPANAARQLQELLQRAERDYREDGSVFRDGNLVKFSDVSDVQLTRALGPIKSFLTRQGVDHATVLDEPKRPPRPPKEFTVQIQPDGAVAVFWKSPDYDGNDAALLQPNTFAAESLTSQLEIIREGGR